MGCWRLIGLGVLGAIFALARPSLADDRATCFAGLVADENIAACSRLIAVSAQPASEVARNYVQRAFLLTRRGGEVDFNRAIADASEALRREPENAIAFAIRAAGHIRNNHLERALADLMESLRLAPQSTTVRNVNGSYHLARGDHQRALAELNEAIRLSPTNYFAFRTRGLVHEKIGELERALADFRVALGADAARAERLGREAAAGIDRVEKLLKDAPRRSAVQPLGGRGELNVDGRVRTFHAVAAAASGPRPTIIQLHGVGGSGAREAQATDGLSPLASQKGFSVVFPDGLGARWNYFPAGKVPASYTESFQISGGVPDDVAFIRMLVADLVRRGASDPARIYLAGTSAGGIMTLRMACLDAGLFAAIAILIAGMPEAVGAECRPAKPLPVLMLSGTADRFLPYSGGPITSADPRLRSGELGSVWPMGRLLGFFRQLNGCGAPPETTSLAGHASRIEVASSAACPGGPVQLYSVVGGGHEVPASLNASQRLLDFFIGKAR